MGTALADDARGRFAPVARTGADHDHPRADQPRAPRDRRVRSAAVEAGGRWTGVGVGVAAGIKLTPLLFIPFLLVTGRVRAAAIAAGTFAATVALGFAIAPSQAERYWLRGTFDDVRRIAPIDSTGKRIVTRAPGAGRDARRHDDPGLGRRRDAPCRGEPRGRRVRRSARRARARARDLRPGVGCRRAVRMGLPRVWFVPLAVVLAERAIVRGSRSSAILLGVLWVATSHGSPGGDLRRAR